MTLRAKVFGERERNDETGETLGERVRIVRHRLRNLVYVRHVYRGNNSA